MSNFVVTNIRLPEEDYLRLKGEAAKQRKSFSAVIREKISQKKTSLEYAKKILAIKGDWFSKKEWQKNRVEVEVRLSSFP